MSRHRIDITGRTFAALTVIKEAGRQNDKHVLWLCRCTCGREITVTYSHLVSGGTKSCGDGHYQSETRTKRCGNITQSLLNSFKQNAKQRNMDFNIDMKYIWMLFKKQKGLCALSGRTIELPALIKTRHMANQGRNHTASLDRIDSNLGYIKGNVQWVHKDINFAKQSMTDEEFIELCSDVVKNHKKKQREIKKKLSNKGEKR